MIQKLIESGEQHEELNLFRNLTSIPIRCVMVEEDQQVNNQITQRVFKLLPRHCGHEKFMTKNMGHNIFRNAINGKNIVESIDAYFTL